MKKRVKLISLRKQKGISQTFISNKLGYAYPSGYNNIENGRSGMSLEQAAIVAEILGVSIDDLAEENYQLFSSEKLHKTCKTSA